MNFRCLSLTEALPSFLSVSSCSSSRSMPCAMSKMEATDCFRSADGRFLGYIAANVPKIKVSTPNVNQTKKSDPETRPGDRFKTYLET